MKPRTRLEKLVAGLSEKLPAITKAQEEWAKEHVFDHVAYKCKNELWCSECGEIWVNTGNSKLDRIPLLPPSIRCKGQQKAEEP